MATILIHPAVAADYKAAHALAERHGMQVTLEAGKPAVLEPVTGHPGMTPARNPAPSSWTSHRPTRPSQGGDAA